MLESWRQSGLTLERFAAQRKLSPQRLYRWKKRLGFSPRRGEQRLVPVLVKQEPKCGKPVTVRLRTGHVLKVPRDFDEHAFARVVALLEGSC